MSPVRHRTGVLAIDEGTTGTRAGVVREDGTVGDVAYRAISVSHPGPLSVEQDPMEIWTATLEVCGRALDGRSAAAVAMSTQRATAVLWDRRTGLPFVPAVVWQDRRYADELAGARAAWDGPLTAMTGRPVGSRQPFYWAARQIAEHAEIASALRDGRLMFGTVDTWLMWKLTGGAVHAMSATNACATGGYLLREHAWHEEWIAELGFPLELLPELTADDAGLGTTDPRVLGAELPVAATIGDQHAALIALGGLAAGDAVCVHGTGTFADVVTGTEPALPRSGIDGVLALIGRRQGEVSHYSLEAQHPATGAALRWLCEDIGMFGSPAQVTELAGQAGSRDGAWFVPALAGTRTPVWDPRATGALTGLTLATTRACVARAVLDGIAHSVCDLLDGVAATMGAPLRRIRVGGGLASSDVLMQAQADFAGMPLERAEDSATASLRGAGYLAGVRTGIWDRLEDVAGAQPAGHVFEPAMACAEREELRGAWRAVAVTAKENRETR